MALYKQIRPSLGSNWPESAEQSLSLLKLHYSDGESYVVKSLSLAEMLELVGL